MSAPPKPVVSIQEVTDRIGRLPLPDVDAVVAIERGGLMAGTIAASLLGRPLYRLRLEYRDDSNAPKYEEPRLVGSASVPIPTGGHVLVVDDVSVTGATLRRAAAELHGLTISTLVLKGDADLVAFPEIETCVTWPWTPGAASSSEHESP
jgi:hypoxanthine phosphoribosyltransferase